MKKLFLSTIGVVIASSIVHAQTTTVVDNDALQQSLEEKAQRIPASDLAAALSAGSGGRSDRARMVRVRPDWAAVRADLERTIAEDAERETSGENDIINRPTRRLLAPPPPPPGLRAFAANRLAGVVQGEVDIVTIPVLAPAHPDIRDNIKIYGQENTYTAAGDIDQDAHFSMSGACDRVTGGAPSLMELRRRLSEGPPILAGLRADYHISRNEFGVDLSFSKFGCGYVMTIECNEPDTDERCTDDRYPTLMARSMMLINPERAAGDQ